MANIRRNIASPLSLGLGEIGVDRKKNVWLRISDSEALHLSGVPGSIVRVIGGSGQRVVVPSAGGGSSTSIKDAADLITNTTNFAGKLSAADTNVQLALDTLDDHVHAHSTNTSLTADDHTQYALLLGRAGGQSLSGGNAANDDLTLQGTTHATRTTSYLKLQPSGGNVGINIATPGTKLHISVDGSMPAAALYNTSADGFLVSNNSNQAGFRLLSAVPSPAANSSAFVMLRSRGTLASPTAVASGDSMGQFLAQGYDGSSRQNSAQIDFAVDGAVGSNIMPGRIVFYTATTNSLIERMRIDSNGRVSIGTLATATAILHLKAGTATASTGPLKFTPAGAVLVTTPEAGLFEVIGDLVHYTIPTGPTRKTFAFTTDIPILVGETRRILLNRWNGNPSTTDGSAAWAWVESGGTADIPYSAFGFAGTTYLEFQTELPDDYGGGTVTAIVKWYTDSATANDVQWSVDARVFHDGDAKNAAFGTAQVIADTNPGANLIAVTGQTPAITIAGTPAAGDMLSVRVARTPGEAADTLDAEVRLISVQLIYTVA